MNHTWTRRLGAGLCALAVAMVMLLTSVMSVAGENVESSIEVTLRIEGIEENLYCGTLRAEMTGGQALTVADILQLADDRDETLTITGIDTGYITAVNGDGSGLTTTAWDGWMVRINGVGLNVGISQATVANGDSIIIYYSDEYVSGMQFPSANTDRLSEGIITFTDNLSGQATAVSGMTVIWHYGSQSSTYTTDNDGKITISTEELTVGDHIVEISRMADGVPTVLRFEPNYTVTVPQTEGETTSESTSEETSYDNVTADVATNNTDPAQTSAASTTKGCSAVAGSTAGVCAIILCGAVAVVSVKNDKERK